MQEPTLDLLLSIFLIFGDNVKIILTGASSAIGKLLFNHYNNQHIVIPISRHYGWDLTLDSKQEELIELTSTADIFLNVAHINYLQGLLLERSRAKVNISFSSLITKFSWQQMKQFNNFEYISQKLFLEYVHKDLKNSALVNISKYGKNDIIPSVTDDQIIYAVNDVINGKAILPKIYEISNGLNNQDLMSFGTH